MLVTIITPSNAAIFPEYIIPNIKYLAQDPEVFVRCIYAQCISQVADTAVRYLEMGQALKAHGTFKLSAEVQEYDQSYFEVCSDPITHPRSSNNNFVFIGLIRCQHAGFAEQHPRASLSTSDGSVKYSQESRLARYFISLHLPRQTENERRSAEPYDHILE